MTEIIDSVIGTMRLEGFDISEQTIENLKRYSAGEVDYEQLLAEIKERYKEEKEK